MTLTLSNSNASALTGGAFTDTLVQHERGRRSGGRDLRRDYTDHSDGGRDRSELHGHHDSGEQQLHGDVQRHQQHGRARNPNTTSGVDHDADSDGRRGQQHGDPDGDRALPTISKAFNPATIQSGRNFGGDPDVVQQQRVGSDRRRVHRHAGEHERGRRSGGRDLRGTTPSTLTAGATALSFTGITIPASGSCTVTFSVTSSTWGNPNTTSGVTTTQTPTTGTGQQHGHPDGAGGATIAKAFNPTSIHLGRQFDGDSDAVQQQCFGSDRRRVYGHAGQHERGGRSRGRHLRGDDSVVH